MIKELIKDVAFDKISVSGALNRAKLIAYEIKNDQFKEWISNELNGYVNNLPDYRIIPCDLFGKVGNVFTGERLVPMDISSLIEQLDLEFDINKMRVVQSIPSIEKSLEEIKDLSVFGYEDFPNSLVSMLSKHCEEPGLVAVKRRIQYSQLNHILNLTKQKLIDTLLELKSAFPNLENNYVDSKENQELTKTIINNYISGDNSNSNIGIGDNITQELSSLYNQKIEKIISDLKKLDVPNQDLEELQKITKESDKSTLGKKLLKWGGKLTQKAIEKGIDLKLPLILDKIQELI